MGLLGPATLRYRASLRAASTSVCWRSPGHSTSSAVTERIRLTAGLAGRVVGPGVAARRARAPVRGHIGEAVTTLPAAVEETVCEQARTVQQIAGRTGVEASPGWTPETHGESAGQVMQGWSTLGAGRRSKLVAR